MKKSLKAKAKESVHSCKFHIVNIPKYKILIETRESNKSHAKVQTKGKNEAVSQDISLTTYQVLVTEERVSHA